MEENISSDLQKYTASISNFDVKRDYISLSHAALDDDELLETTERFEDTLAIRLRCYKGYQMEKDLLMRIKNLYGKRVEAPVEIVAFNGLVRGHPDFRFDGYPSDCKTLPLEEYFKDRVSRKIYLQMQAYMLYSEKDKALVIMEARDTGAIRHYWIMADKFQQQRIHDKYSRIVARLNK